MSRLHPFDLVFGEIAARRFGEIRDAMSSTTTGDRRRFLQLAPVQTLLEELAPAETPLRAALMEEYGTLLYAAYHYWLDGQRTFDVTMEDLDRAAEKPASGDPPANGEGARYVRLPERRMWGQIGEGAPHEPLDGLFVVSGAGGAELTVVAVLGLRPDRDGFSQIAVTAPRQDIPDAARARRIPLFAPLMEGGERAGFRSVATEGELMDLACLALISARH